MKKLNIVYLAGMLLIGGCGMDSSPQDRQENGQAPESTLSEQGGSFTGYDRDGMVRTCTAILPQTSCTMIYGPGEAFENLCRERGYKSFQCGCHDYLCSEPVSTER